MSKYRSGITILGIKLANYFSLFLKHFYCTPILIEARSLTPLYGDSLCARIKILLLDSIDTSLLLLLLLSSSAIVYCCWQPVTLGCMYNTLLVACTLLCACACVYCMRAVLSVYVCVIVFVRGSFGESATLSFCTHSLSLLTKIIFYSRTFQNGDLIVIID